METNSHNRCISGDPLISFGDGNSQELKLNLPQSTCFIAQSIHTIYYRRGFEIGNTTNRRFAKGIKILININELYNYFN
jgi:hypothetical protein